MAKNQIVLTCDSEGVADRPFDLAHAERLLSMPNNGGWKIPADSPYQFSQNAITRKRDTGKPSKAAKDRGDK